MKLISSSASSLSEQKLVRISSLLGSLPHSRPRTPYLLFPTILNPFASTHRPLPTCIFLFALHPPNSRPLPPPIFNQLDPSPLSHLLILFLFLAPARSRPRLRLSSQPLAPRVPQSPRKLNLHHRRLPLDTRRPNRNSISTLQMLWSDPRTRWANTPLNYLRERLNDFLSKNRAKKVARRKMAQSSASSPI